MAGRSDPLIDHAVPRPVRADDELCRAVCPEYLSHQYQALEEQVLPPRLHPRYALPFGNRHDAHPFYPSIELRYRNRQTVDSPFVVTFKSEHHGSQGSHGPCHPDNRHVGIPALDRTHLRPDVLRKPLQFFPEGRIVLDKELRQLHGTDGQRDIPLEPFPVPSRDLRAPAAYVDDDKVSPLDGGSDRTER